MGGVGAWGWGDVLERERGRVERGVFTVKKYRSKGQ